jgi:hypothetical protein
MTARLHVRPDVEKHFKMAGVGRFASRRIERDDRARGVRFGVNFRGEASARTLERSTLFPPFAPAADTWARTIVESNL